MTTVEILIQTIINGILLGGIYACFGIGLSLLWGVMRVGNFAHGAIAFIGTYLFYGLLTSFGIDPILSMLIPIPLFLVIGVILYRLILNPVYIRVRPEDFEMSAMLSTFGLALAIESILSLKWGTDILTIPSSSLKYLRGTSITFGPIFITSQGLLSLSLAVSSMVLLHLFLTKTYLGLAIRAVSQNREMARALGANIQNIWLLATGIACILASMAGIAMSLTYAFYPQGYIIWNIKAFIVVTLGGLGSMVGMFLGGLILGISENLAMTLLPSFFSSFFPHINVLPLGFRDVIALLIFLIILLIRPQGLLGRGS
jgi:branched-chain amino acid transport system permease protein